MIEDKVTRIGPGVPVRQEPKPKKWFGIKPEFVIAAAVVIAMAMMVTGVLVFDERERGSAGTAPSISGPPTEVQIECAAIKHDYVIWKRTDTDFANLATVKSRLVADMHMGSLKKAGDSFVKAATGYRDQPSKKLAVSISQHNYDLAVINLELTAANEITAENYQKARTSRHEVEKDYESFLALTCS